MSRRDNSFPSELFEFLVQAPIWTGPLIAAPIYSVIKWVFPWVLIKMDSNKIFGTVVSEASPGIAAIVAIFVLFIWVCAVIFRVLKHYQNRSAPKPSRRG